jgi:UDP-2,3-diacylglucosamine pyrophosphatase LpxH
MDLIEPTRNLMILRYLVDKRQSKWLISILKTKKRIVLVITQMRTLKNRRDLKKKINLFQMNLN